MPKFKQDVFRLRGSTEELLIGPDYLDADGQKIAYGNGREIIIKDNIDNLSVEPNCKIIIKGSTDSIICEGSEINSLGQINFASLDHYSLLKTSQSVQELEMNWFSTSYIKGNIEHYLFIDQGSKILIGGYCEDIEADHNSLVIANRINGSIVGDNNAKIFSKDIHNQTIVINGGLLIGGGQTEIMVAGQKNDYEDEENLSLSQVIFVGQPETILAINHSQIIIIASDPSYDPYFDITQTGQIIIFRPVNKRYKLEFSTYLKHLRDKYILEKSNPDQIFPEIEDLMMNKLHFQKIVITLNRGSN